MAIDKGQTAEIFSLIKTGDFRPFKQFIELYHGELDTKYISAYTPLMEAVFLQKQDFVEYICTHLRNKYKNNRESYYKYLNAFSSDGKTALMIATLGNSDTKIIEYLLSQGANPKIKDLHGKNVQDYALFATTQEVEDFWNQF